MLKLRATCISLHGDANRCNNKEKKIGQMLSHKTF